MKWVWLEWGEWYTVSMVTVDELVAGGAVMGEWVWLVGGGTCVVLLMATVLLENKLTEKLCLSGMDETCDQ